jgi:hypothetical protein
MFNMTYFLTSLLCFLLGFLGVFKKETIIGPGRRVMKSNSVRIVGVLFILLGLYLFTQSHYGNVIYIGE